MSRESDLIKEINDKTKEFERIKREKEKAEEDLYRYSTNLSLVEKIEYIQRVIKSLENEDIDKKGWYFLIGKKGNSNDSFIKFANEGELIIPNEPEIFKDFISYIYDILEEKKNSLKEG